MEKQEVIKKAYGESYDALKDDINENGFVDCVKNRKISLIPFFDVSEIEFNGHLSRPNSLKGIENNNGWVKIYHHNDLPQFECACWWMDKNSGLILGRFIFNGHFDFIMENATHYKIISTTELPIY
jgi:hypothetical protein